MKPILLWLALASFMIFSACSGDRAAHGIPPHRTEQKTVKIRVTGRIVAVTDTALKVEHTIKGGIEVLDLDLEIPIRRFKVGDRVIVWYVIKGKRKILKEIRPLHVLKDKEPPEGSPGGKEDTYV